MRLIIIEGPQGTGKSTLANHLRDNISSSNLLRLSGQKEKGIDGKKISEKMYDILMDYLEKMQDINMDIIFDRTFFSEECYARLGYKEYQFTDVYEKLLERLNNLKYETYFINLYLEDTSLYKERLARPSHHNYQAFSTDSSISQQNTYKELSDGLKDYKNINVINLCMDDFKEAYEKINKLFNISVK